MCCDPTIVDDKKILGICPSCDGDVNADGQSIEDGCSYSPMVCDKCEYQPCDWSC